MSLIRAKKNKLRFQGKQKPAGCNSGGFFVGPLCPQKYGRKCLALLWHFLIIDEFSAMRA
jgi:hypothetical protein